VLAIRIGACARDESPDGKWIIFDGPVDAKWIENMNTVLDDNKKLCLASGAIIKLKPSMRIMFEVDDLSYASPATISRCGMVLLEPEELGHNVLITSYGNEMAKIVDRKIVDKVLSIMHYVCDCVCFYAYMHCSFPVPTGPNFVVNNFLKVFHSFIIDWEPTEDEPNRVPKDAEETCMNAILFALIWGIGAQIDEKTRKKIDVFLQDLCNGEEVIKKYELDVNHQEVVTFKHGAGTEYTSLFDMSYNPDE
jgi:dynein heavy chain